MCVLGVLVLGFISLQNHQRKKKSSFFFGKTLCKYCWWKINICCTPSFHLSLEMMKKTMIFMNNSGDVDDAEADYTCPSWTRAFDVCCIFVGGDVRSGQEKKKKKRKEWYPTHPRPAVATLPHTFVSLPRHLLEINCGICGANCSLCFSCHKTLCLCYKEQKQLWFVRGLYASLWSHCPGLLGITSHPVCLEAWGFTIMPLC